MLDEQLKIRGRSIVSELELGVDQTTEKWMAHYLAELMERAENAESAKTREQAASESAHIILTLWEQKKKKFRHEYYSALNSAFSHVYEKKRPFAEALQSVLDDPEQIDSIEEFPDQLAVLFYIDFYETDLLRLYLIADVVAKIQNYEMAEEVIREFENAEEMFISTKRHLQDVWPDIESLRLTEVKQLQTFISAKLNAFHQTRSRLLARIGLV